jgi:DNA-binding transcriptional LysR family regulator
MTDSGPPADLDLRLVRYFTVVAQHRHFGRAAAELRVAQPSLSRQIRQLEVQLGVRLLDRDRQGTRLTAAGEVFLARARTLLRTAAQAAAATRAAADPARIVIGYTTGLTITAAVRQLRRQHPDAEVQTQYLEWNEPRAALLDHRVDAAVTRLPLNTSGLHVTILYDEPRVLLVPTSGLPERSRSPSTTSPPSRSPATPIRSGTPTGASTRGRAGSRPPAGRPPRASRTSSNTSRPGRRWRSSRLRPTTAGCAPI